jgi:NADPH oxidase 2
MSVNSNSRPSSGLDFSDRGQDAVTLDQHPDLSNGSVQATFLNRNKTERRRIQGLQRTNTAVKTRPSVEAMSWKQKFDLWMINEGGRRLFFGVWAFLHLLVAVLGFLNYQLKDNSVNARALFGITFRAFNTFLSSRGALFNE